METTAVNRQREAVAQALGVQVEQLATVEPKWLELMREGVLVSLHIARGRSEVRLTWEDLGLPIARADANLDTEAKAGRQASGGIMKPGVKSLLPSKTLDSLNTIANSARASLERRAYKTYWGWFLTPESYAAWLQDVKEYQDKYFAIRDDLVANHADMVKSVLTEYRRAARAAYRRMFLLDPEAMTREQYRDELGYVEMFVSRIERLIPSAEEIQAGFRFYWDLSYVPLPSLLAEDKAEGERIAAGWQIERQERQALEQMRWDVKRQAEQQKAQQVDGFLKDLVSQLRGLVYEATTDVLASIQKNGGKLKGRSVVQLRGLFEQVSQLNFMGDQEINAALAKVQEVMGAGVKDRDVKEIEQRLSAIATITRASLMDLGMDAPPRSARAVGIADNPTQGMVRTARRSLGLISEAEAEAEELEPIARSPRQARAIEIGNEQLVEVRRRPRS